MFYNYDVGDSIRVGDSIVFFLGVENKTRGLALIRNDGSKAFSVDPFGICKCRKFGKTHKRVYKGMQVRQCDGEFAEIYEKPAGTRKADIIYHGFYYENIEVSCFLEGIYKLQGDSLVLGTVEEREETLKKMGITPEDLKEEEYKNFEAVFGTSVEAQKQIEEARQVLNKRLEDAVTDEAKEVLLNSYDGARNIEGVSDRRKYTRTTSTDGKTSEKCLKKDGEERRSVTLKGLSGGITLSKDNDGDSVHHVNKVKVEEKTSKSEPLFSLEKAKVGMSFRNKCGVLFTVIKVGKNNSVVVVAGTKASVTMTITEDNIIGLDSITHSFGSRVGLRIPQNNNLIAEIVEDNEDRLTVRYECGAYQTGISYDDFANGKLVCPIESENYLRRTFKQKDGHIAMIIAYRSKDDISILLDDGTYIKSTNYASVESGTFVYNGKKGDEHKNVLGMKSTITKYANRDDISVEFDDGSTVSHTTLDAFLGGTVVPDYMYVANNQYCIGMIRGIEKAVLSGGNYVFEGTCSICNNKVSGTRTQLQSHIC